MHEDPHMSGSVRGLQEIPLMDHLEELRNRLVKSLIASLAGFMACYAFAKDIFRVMMAPLTEVIPPGSHLIYTDLPEAFFTYVKVAFVAGLFLVSPYIFYQFWQFIAPGLHKADRKFFIPTAFFSALFFVCGSLFGYLIVFPFGFDFFMGYADEIIKPMPTVREYFNFSLKLLLAFGLIFELPLCIFFLARLGLVSAASLRKKRRHFILAAFILGAILTPPDAFTQILMAGPLIVLYEISIVVANVFGKKKHVVEMNALGVS